MWHAIDRLGSRPRKERLRAAIEAICAVRDWTTPGDHARYLWFSQRNLGARHLPPMVAEEQLEWRYPDNPTHPDQAYAVSRRDRSDPAGYLS